jgi:hypothetical protein
MSVLRFADGRPRRSAGDRHSGSRPRVRARRRRCGTAAGCQARRRASRGGSRLLRPSATPRQRGSSRRLSRRPSRGPRPAGRRGLAPDRQADESPRGGRAPAFRRMRPSASGSATSGSGLPSEMVRSPRTERRRKGTTRGADSRDSVLRPRQKEPASLAKESEYGMTKRIGSRNACGRAAARNVSAQGQGGGPRWPRACAASAGRYRAPSASRE